MVKSIVDAMVSAVAMNEDGTVENLGEKYGKQSPTS